MSVILQPKKSSTLHDLPYANPNRKCLHAWVINVTPSGPAHCVHRCTFCYAREAVYSDAGDKQVVYSNLPELVAHDLERISLCPPISISNTTDPCQDVPELRRQVKRLVAVLMSYGVSFSINTKGDPSFLFDLPGFAAYEPKFIAVSIEGPPEILRLLSPGAPDYDARLESVRQSAGRGIKTAVRLDPVLAHVWRAVYGSDWIERLEGLADAFAGAGAKHIISSTGRLDKYRPRWLGGDQPPMWQRILRIVEHRSPAVARDLEREHCDRSESNNGFRLRADLRLAFHRHARDVFERRGLTYATCLELPAEACDSAGLPHCEGFAIPFARKGSDGKFHPIPDCTANCHVRCRDTISPPCGRRALVKPAPFKPAELR